MIALQSLSTNHLTLRLFWELGQGVPTWKLSNYDFSPNAGKYLFFEIEFSQFGFLQ